MGTDGSAKHIEKLRYMRRKPGEAGLVESRVLWAWSSFRAYWLGEAGPAKIGS